MVHNVPIRYIKTVTKLHMFSYCMKVYSCILQSGITPIFTGIIKLRASHVRTARLPSPPPLSGGKSDFDFSVFFGAPYQLTAEILPFDINHCFGRLFGVLCFVFPLLFLNYIPDLFPSPSNPPTQITKLTWFPEKRNIFETD